MLAVSPLRSSNTDEEREGDFLLEDINFNDLFVGFDEGDVLPDLEIDPNDIFADFSFESGEQSWNTAAVVPDQDLERTSGENDNKSACQGEVEVVSLRAKEETSSSSKNRNGRKSASATTGQSSQGKKKAKVDWTPELHRIVQAVEQLGVDKAVPSRILELMGTDCLTRHNIASHLQPLTQGTPCFPPPLMPPMMQRFPAASVLGIPPHPLFGPPLDSVAPLPSKHLGSLTQQLDAQPSNESIDAAIGDVLAKPWSPFPLGLKPPPLESVMVELQKQGVAKVPSACS